MSGTVQCSFIVEIVIMIMVNFLNIELLIVLEATAPSLRSIIL